MTQPHTIGFLGPPGTYTEEAASAVTSGAKLLPLASIEAVFEAVQEGTCDRGVVPMENVIHGPVTETLDCLYAHADRLRIVDMLP